MEKIIPFSGDAEKNLLASIIVQPDILFDLLPKLNPDDFYDLRHRDIYKVLVNLNKEGKNIEYVSILEEYKKVCKTFTQEDQIYILEMSSSLSSAFMYLNYLNTVLENSNKRKLIQLGKELVEKNHDASLSFSANIDYIENKIKEINEKREVNKLSSLKEVWELVEGKAEDVKKLRAKLGENFTTTGIATGFDNLDIETSGLQKEELIIIAARPGVGKSAFAMQLALNIAGGNKTVVFFSLEMSTIQLGQRVIANLCEIPLNEIKSATLSAEQSYMIKHTLNDYQNYNLFFDDQCNGTIDDIRAKIRRLQQEKGIDLIIVDYLQLLSEPGIANRQEEVSKISRRLKQLAREFKVPIIALSQLSREVEKRENKMPILADLRESGSIEQDADVVMFLYSADKYKKPGEAKDNTIQLIISKNRQGSAPSTLNYKFFGHLSKYEESEVKV